MTALAQAPLPLIASLTILALALLAIIAKAVFAPTDAPARRLCAILAIIRRQHRTPGARSLCRQRSARETPVILPTEPRARTPELSHRLNRQHQHDNPAHNRAAQRTPDSPPTPPAEPRTGPPIVSSRTQSAANRGGRPPWPTAGRYPASGGLDRRPVSQALGTCPFHHDGCQ